MIPLPSTPTIIEKKDNSAVFKIEGLYPGYGVTVGNALRRVLLSSLEGAAITQVKIKGAPHEFSTISGVMEDVVNILINLKQLRFKLHGEELQKAVLSVKGEKEAKGSDFELPTQLELINKDNHVAELTAKKSELEIEIQVEKGMGYEPVELRKRGKLEIGTIAVDAIFTPIRKVSYRVENMRVGDRTDYDRLFLEIETDGSISPEEAIVSSTEILNKHLSMIESAFKEQAEAAAVAETAPAKTVKKTSTKKNEKKKTGKKTK
jgi:DNA-directed RNA polymerase subunit alpha